MGGWDGVDINMGVVGVGVGWTSTWVGGVGHL